MHVTNQQAVRASRRTLIAAAYCLAAGIAMIALPARVHAAPRGGHSVAFAPPTTTLSAEDIRPLVYREGSNRSPDLDLGRQPGDRFGAETGTAGFRARQDPNILAVSTSSRRMRTKRPKASHSRLRRMN